jgi:CRISPR-associated exonuclease Cas4
MIIFNKHAFAIIDMFFPNCMYSYLLKDPQLELIGMCDKIEISDGKYYPVIIKNSNPPLKGVWDQDAIELVACAILIEEEFETDVYVGFVDYDKIGERRPVVMDVNLRKGLFDVMREVKEITDNKKLPNVKKNPRKCDTCEYIDICIKE